MRPGAYAGLPLTGYVNCKLYWYNDFPLIRPFSPSLSGAEILLTLPLPLPLLLPLSLCAVPLPPCPRFPVSAAIASSNFSSSVRRLIRLYRLYRSVAALAPRRLATLLPGSSSSLSACMQGNPPTWSTFSPPVAVPR